jgi:hypothetical protein
LLTNDDELNINIKTPQDYCNNLNVYLTACLVIICEDLEIAVPPLILCNEKYNKQKKGFESNIDTDILYIDIKAEDYLGELLHQLGLHIGMDEETAMEFVDMNRDRFPRIFSWMVTA